MRAWWDGIGGWKSECDIKNYICLLWNGGRNHNLANVNCHSETCFYWAVPSECVCYCDCVCADKARLGGWELHNWDTCAGAYTNIDWRKWIFLNSSSRCSANRRCRRGTIIVIFSVWKKWLCYSFSVTQEISDWGCRRDWNICCRLTRINKDDLKGCWQGAYLTIVSCCCSSNFYWVGTCISVSSAHRCEIQSWSWIWISKPKRQSLVISLRSNVLDIECSKILTWRNSKVRDRKSHSCTKNSVWLRRNCRRNKLNYVNRQGKRSCYWSVRR